MEGGEAAEPQAEPARKGKLRLSKRMMAVVVGIVAVIIVASLVVVAFPNLLGTTNPGGGDMFRDPHVGDYMEYETSMGFITMTNRVEVVDVSGDNVTIAQTTTIGDAGGFTAYQNVTKEEAFRAGQYDPYKIAPGWAVDNRGKQLVSTPYGARNCDHFALSNTTEQMGATLDVFLYRGILIKVNMVSGPIDMPVLMMTSTNLNVVVRG